jgi:hypothetical protein
VRIGQLLEAAVSTLRGLLFLADGKHRQGLVRPLEMFVPLPEKLEQAQSSGRAQSFGDYHALVTGIADVVPIFIIFCLPSARVVIRSAETRSQEAARQPNPSFSLAFSAAAIRLADKPKALMVTSQTNSFQLVVCLNIRRMADLKPTDPAARTRARGPTFSKCHNRHTATKQCRWSTPFSWWINYTGIQPPAYLKITCH